MGLGVGNMDLCHLPICPGLMETSARSGGSPQTLPHHLISSSTHLADQGGKSVIEDLHLLLLLRLLLLDGWVHLEVQGHQQAGVDGHLGEGASRPAAGQASGAEARPGGPSRGAEPGASCRARLTAAEAAEADDAGAAGHGSRPPGPGAGRLEAGRVHRGWRAAGSGHGQGWQGTGEQTPVGQCSLAPGGRGACSPTDLLEDGALLPRLPPHARIPIPRAGDWGALGSPKPKLALASGSGARLGSVIGCLVGTQAKATRKERAREQAGGCTSHRSLAAYLKSDVVQST